MKNKTIYYKDELNDDFASTNIKSRTVDGDFPYVHRSFAWRAASALLYYAAALPLVFVINGLIYGVRIKNRRALKGIKGGFFLYGNHTQYFTDATCPAMLAFPKKAYVIAGADAVSIKGISILVQMLGGLILPTEISGVRPFKEAVRQRCGENAAVAIYPEAHIWPYYTGIRPFGPASFTYPVKLGLPAVAYVITYRKRLLGFLPPAIDITLSEPYYPDASLGEREARDDLRNKIYAFMCRAARKNEVEYVKYVKIGDGPEDENGKPEECLKNIYEK